MEKSIRELDDGLDKFESQLGLSKVEPVDNEHIINQYLTYSFEELNKTDAQGIAIMHFEVSSFLTTLQRVVNRLEAKYNYASDNGIKREIKAKMDRLKFLNFPLKNLLKSLEMLHSSKEIEKKEDYYEHKRQVLYNERQTGRQTE